MVQQCGKADVLILFRLSPYTFQPRYRGFLALCRSRGGFDRVLLGPAPSLRRLLCLRFVRRFLRYGVEFVSVIDIKSMKEVTRIPVGQVPKRNITAMLQ